jgi:long-chain acyl-CoA synthetase
LYSGADHCWVEAQVRFEDGRVGSVRAELRIVPAKTIGLADQALPQRIVARAAA